MNIRFKNFLAVLAIAIAPSLAVAQSTISGVVKDSSGAVVAGASVEAVSDALIERSRKVTTDGEGRYAIVDLRPGAYVVTATAPGFAAVKQSVEVPANTAVPVDATLQVGAVGETVNIEARIPTVDVENASHQETLSRAEMDSLPTARYMQALAYQIPGSHIDRPDVGGSYQIEQNYISVHGNDPRNDTYMLDGLLANTLYADGTIQVYIDNAAIQETTYQTSNVTSQSSAGGMFTNLVPKDGGNQFHFDFFGAGSGGTGFFQGTNFNDKLKARGVPGPSLTDRVEDFDGSFGGPLIRDKLWFQLSGRRQVTNTQAGGSYYPDGRPGIQEGGIYSPTFRLTYQANARNKFSAFWLRNWKYKDHQIVDGGVAGLPFDPSTSSNRRVRWPMYYIAQFKWTSTLTSKLVTDVGMSLNHLDYNEVYQQGIDQPPYSPDWYGLTSQFDLALNRRYTSGTYPVYWQTTRNYFSASATYVTGSHQMKGGVQYSFGPNRQSVIMNGDGYSYFSNGLPLVFVAFDTPVYRRAYLNADMAAYLMDTWHFKRLTITAGVRMEYLNAQIDPEHAPAGRFVPGRNIPQIDCGNKPGMGCWVSFVPRLGVVYDLFGNHKTAIKAGFGKYNTQYGVTHTLNFNPMVIQTQTLSWNAPTDGSCAPVTVTVLGVANITPNPRCFTTAGYAPPGTTAANIPVNGLGPNANLSFGTATNIPRLDPGFQREYSLQYNVGLQQELFRTFTLNLGWYRRESRQGVQINNLAMDNSYYSPFTITNPLDGAPITVFNLTKAIGPAQLYQTNTPHSLVRNSYSGFEASITARPGAGQFWVFGWTHDRDMQRNCSENTTTGTSRNDPNSLRFCDYFGDSNLSFQGINIKSLGVVPSPPWHDEFKLHGAIPIKWGVMGSVALTSLRLQASNFTPSNQNTSADYNNGYLSRQWTITSTTVYPTDCNCPLAGQRVDPNLGTAFGQSSLTINLVPPGKVLTPRLNQVDFGVRRVFKFGEKYRLEPEIQWFNLFNSNAVITQSESVPASAGKYSIAAFLEGGIGGPITVYTPPRLMRLAIQFHF
jgi:hypothetical protein